MKICSKANALLPILAAFLLFPTVVFQAFDGTLAGYEPPGGAPPSGGGSTSGMELQ